MAIIPNVPHVVVDIVVDGKPLPEYLDEDDDKAVSSNSTTKYVECVSGSKFAIQTDITGLGRRHLRGSNSVEVAFFVDGQPVRGVVYKDPWQPVCVQHSSRDQEAGTWKERELTFANIVTSMLTEGSIIKVIANITISS
jgi:hypothetical protein